MKYVLLKDGYHYLVSKDKVMGHTMFIVHAPKPDIILGGIMFFTTRDLGIPTYLTDDETLTKLNERHGGIKTTLEMEKSDEA